MKKPLLSIVFPNFNSKKDCQVLLNSLMKTELPSKDMEVIMVDNNSSDESVKFVEKHFPKVIIIKSPKNVGPGAARNIGIKNSHGEYILCTDNDASFDKTSFQPLIDLLKSRPTVGVVGGNILNKKDDRLVSAGFHFNRFLGIENGNRTPKKETECDWLGGAFFMFPKTLIDKIGLFDDKFFLYAEDADYCLRAKKKGFKILYSPVTAIHHGKENDNRAMTTKEDFYQYYKSKFRLIKKHLSPIQQLTSCLFHLTIAVLLRLLSGKPEYPFLKYKAFLEGFK